MSRCAVTYESSSSPFLVPHGSGTGNVSELAEKLDDDKVVYGIVRKVGRFEESSPLCFLSFFR